MGCGKSSVGRELSRLLCCPFMDLDDVIVEREGRSIPEIFASDGEAAFRQMELQALKDIAVAEGWKQSLPSQAMGPSLCGQRGSTVSNPSPLPQSHLDNSANSVHQADAPLPSQAMGSTVSNPSPLPPSHLDNCDSSTRLADGRLSTYGNASRSSEAYTQAMMVLALGGGTVMTEGCREIVERETTCVYLKASVETLLDHLEGQTEGRPMLAGTCHSERPKGVEESSLRQRILELMARRAETYENTAHVIIETNGRSIADIAQEISSLDQI